MQEKVQLNSTQLNLNEGQKQQQFMLWRIITNVNNKKAANWKLHRHKNSNMRLIGARMNNCRK
jgi:hypothetical protein